MPCLPEIYRDSPERRRECLYYLALGHYKINNFVDARLFVRQLLKLEPNHVQAVALNKMIDEKVSRGMTEKGSRNNLFAGLLRSNSSCFPNRGSHRHSHSQFSFRCRSTFSGCYHFEKKIKMKEEKMFRCAVKTTNFSPFARASFFLPFLLPTLTDSLSLSLINISSHLVMSNLLEENEHSDTAANGQAVEASNSQMQVDKSGGSGPEEMQRESSDVTMTSVGETIGTKRSTDSFMDTNELNEDEPPKTRQRTRTGSPAGTKPTMNQAHKRTQRQGSRSSTQPRWHNQAYMLFLALRQHPDRCLSRPELIKAALALDEKISKERNLPRVFKGKVMCVCVRG